MTFLQRNLGVNQSLEFLKTQLKYPIEIYCGNESLCGSLAKQTELLQKSTRIIIGDLHGNIRKALEILILAEVVGLSLVDFERFLELFVDGNFESETKIEEICKIIKRIKLLKPKKIIFLGDILGDRVANDILGLEFINHLRHLGLDCQTLIGNHDHACNFKDNSVANSMRIYADSFFHALTIYNSTESKFQFEIDDLLKRFIGLSKLIMFQKEIRTLIVHAPVTKRNLVAFQKLLISIGVLQRDFVLNADSFEQFCQKINEFYVDYRNNGKYSDKKYIIENKVLKSTSSDGLRRLEGFLWVGEHIYTDQVEFFHSLGIDRIIHGHDSFDQDSILNPKNINYDKNSLTIINLDSLNGKSLEVNYESLPLYIEV